MKLSMNFQVAIGGATGAILGILNAYRLFVTQTGCQPGANCWGFLYWMFGITWGFLGMTIPYAFIPAIQLLRKRFLKLGETTR